MAKPENEENDTEKQTWSTWEELLLACAVHRHGIDSWDSVAAEIQKHNSTFRTFTALDCRHKYNDLKRRFSRKLVSPGESIAEISSVPWLEELRKLRVDELRREVERYDISISSLQLKVKKLEDEREKSLKETETETETEKSDLGQKIESHRESGEKSGDPVTDPADSPDPKDNSPGTGSENTNRDREITELANEEPNRIDGGDDDGKPVREDSCRGSCDSESADREDPVKDGNDSSELVESMDESKGEEEVEAKETSDVQSSASLSRKENQSLTVDKIPVESQPLIDFIEILQSHPIGSLFSLRLESQQEAPEYDKIIKQDIDFEMIRTRVEEGYYKISRRKFFRDLLLLINNARVVYGEGSSEFDAAKELNQLIKKQMMVSLKIPKQTEESLVKEEEVTVSSLKPKMSIVACRKRSSLAVRSPATSVTEKKTKVVVPTVDEKAVSEEEENETSEEEEEPVVSKKTSRGKTPSTSKKVERRNVKTSLNAGLSSKVRGSSNEPKKRDQEKKGNDTNGGSKKKQSAASFLKRMKETVKSDSSNGKTGAEQKRSNSKNDKVDAPAGQKRANAKKPTIEKGSSTKKRVAAQSSSPKRGSEETGSSTRPKKRSKR